jgi:hypothetical protein
VPSFVNYKKGCTRLAIASDKVYQLLAHGQWFSPASSTTKTGRHDIAEILLKVTLSTKKFKFKFYGISYKHCMGVFSERNTCFLAFLKFRHWIG